MEELIFLNFNIHEFRKFEIPVVLHFFVPNFDPHPKKYEILVTVCMMLCMCEGGINVF